MNIFMHAIKYRQEKVYRYLCGLRSKAAMVACVDSSENNALHLAGMLAPDSKLRHIPGAALKVQRELQWFKEIQRVMLPHDSERKNINMMTPREVFTTNHKELMIEGEKWMKETASFCVVASALVVGIMFAAAITIPGGNDQKFGFPIFLDEQLFRVFIFSTVVSVFSSIISVLEFLGIITSRYAEEDFLMVLPTTMTLGVTFLLLSIATMLMAFIAVIFIMFTEEPWIRIPIILLSAIPVIFFAWQIFPILSEIVISTYYRSFFERKDLPYYE
ncbi:PGG domain containing protein [Trema orientale]|uniref:PGG domain containing protein n=1 Tax=Trema orientale TaxID=63057 RepID=A0A2P5BG25_TREOI|nr:PGG domain containing protein [Trema orientale]